MNYVVDTHILIWYFIGSSRLPVKIREVIDNCLTGSGMLIVPTIVLTEALDLSEKGRSILILIIFIFILMTSGIYNRPLSTSEISALYHGGDAIA